MVLLDFYCGGMGVVAEEESVLAIDGGDGEIDECIGTIGLGGGDHALCHVVSGGDEVVVVGGLEEAFLLLHFACRHSE